MKNRILKVSFALAISSCLLFTACGAEQTVAPIEESATESTVESTTDVVEESETVVENDMESDVVESEVTNEVDTETPSTGGVDSVGGWEETDTDEVIYEDEYVEPVEEETTTDTSSSSGDSRLDAALDFWKQMYEQGGISEEEYNKHVEGTKEMAAEQEQKQQSQSQPSRVVIDRETLIEQGLAFEDTTDWDNQYEFSQDRTLPDYLKGNPFK